MSAMVIPFPLERRVDAALAAARMQTQLWRPHLNRLAGYNGRAGYVRELDLTRGRCRIVFLSGGDWAWAPYDDLIPPSTEGLEA